MFSWLGHRIQVPLNRKIMFFLHNSACALCSIEHTSVLLNTKGLILLNQKGLPGALYLSGWKRIRVAREVTTGLGVSHLYSLPWTILQCTLSYIIMSLRWLQGTAFWCRWASRPIHVRNVCVCVCSLLSWSARPLLIWYKKSDYLNVSGANCQNVLSWLLFLEKLAKH